MNNRKIIPWLAGLVVLLTLAGCGPSDDESTSAPSSTHSYAATPPARTAPAAPTPHRWMRWLSYGQEGRTLVDDTWTRMDTSNMYGSGTAVCNGFDGADDVALYVYVDWSPDAVAAQYAIAVTPQGTTLFKTLVFSHGEVVLSFDYACIGTQYAILSPRDPEPATPTGAVGQDALLSLPEGKTLIPASDGVVIAAIDVTTVLVTDATSSWLLNVGTGVKTPTAKRLVGQLPEAVTPYLQDHSKLPGSTWSFLDEHGQARWPVPVLLYGQQDYVCLDKDGSVTAELGTKLGPNPCASYSAEGYALKPVGYALDPSGYELADRDGNKVLEGKSITEVLKSYQPQLRWAPVVVGYRVENDDGTVALYSADLSWKSEDSASIDCMDGYCLVINAGKSTVVDLAGGKLTDVPSSLTQWVDDSSDSGLLWLANADRTSVYNLGTGTTVAMGNDCKDVWSSGEFVGCTTDNSDTPRTVSRVFNASGVQQPYRDVKVYDTLNGVTYYWAYQGCSASADGSTCTPQDGADVDPGTECRGTITADGTWKSQVCGYYA